MEHKGIALKEYQDFLDNVKPPHRVPIPWWKSYRIVKSGYGSFYVHVKYCWWPFWFQISTWDTLGSIEQAEARIIRDLQPTVAIYKYQSGK